MQKYFNTNTVSAEPMDELEAYEKGYVRSYSVSGYSKAPRQGYHVQYTDQGVAYVTVGLLKMCLKGLTR